MFAFFNKSKKMKPGCLIFFLKRASEKFKPLVNVFFFQTSLKKYKTQGLSFLFLKLAPKNWCIMKRNQKHREILFFLLDLLNVTRGAVGFFFLPG